MRIWVRTCPKIGASRTLGRHASPVLAGYRPSVFHGPAEARGTQQEPLRSSADRVTNALSLEEWFQGPRRLN